MSESEEKSEMLVLLKTLVDKVNELEKAVYDKDNILMKSGYVVSNTPTPVMATENQTTNDVSQMEWTEINKMMSKIEGA
tara:strand:+ start:328 stop:564 length:237 start_codon:yes stop_codon:yes gene_type:complete